MGIDSEWRIILFENHKHCFYKKIPDDVQIHKAIKDMTSEMFSLVPYSTDYLQILGRFKLRLHENVCGTGLKCYVLLFDEFSPRNKRPKDMAEEIPRAEIEQKNIRVPDGAFPDNPMRLLSTYSLKRSLYHYMAYSISAPKVESNEKTECTILIDGAPAYRGPGEVVIHLRDYYQARERTYHESNYTEKPSYGVIGESDLKVVYHISRTSPGENIMVLNSDGDLLPVILLNMRDWIDKETGKIPFTVWLHYSKNQKSLNQLREEGEKETYKQRLEKDKNGNRNEDTNVEDMMDIDTSTVDEEIERMKSQGKKKKVTKATMQKEEFKKYCLINVNELFISLCSKFRHDYEIDFGPYVFSVLILTHKTDFVNNIPNIGVKKIWKAFINGGYKILSGRASPSQDGDSKKGKGKKATTRFLQIDHETIGEPNALHNIWIDEEKMMNFIKFMLHYELNKKAKPETYVTCDMLEMLQSSKKKGNTSGDNAIERARFTIPDEEEIKAIIRRILWNLMYWVLGGKVNSTKIQPVPNPMQKSNGKPVFGWEFNKEGKLVYSTRVAPIFVAQEELRLHRNMLGVINMVN